MSRAGSDALRPLRHEQALSEPELVLGARLLQHALPLAKSEARKRRVWNALGAGQSSRLGFRLGALRAAFAGVLFAAVSSAAVGQYYVRKQSAAPSVGSAAPARPPRVNGPSRHQRPPGAAAVASAATPLAAAPDFEPLAVTPPPTTRPRSEVTPRRPADADAELLVQAMRARRAGDARRVSQLADAYRRKHPQGVLQEEALMLSLEAATQRHAANASSLANEYLTRFPNGRFAAQARRALASDAQ